MDNGDIESAEEEFPGRIGARKYRPVVANDRAVLQMSSIDPGSSSSSSAAVHQASLQYFLPLSLSLSRIGFFVVVDLNGLWNCDGFRSNFTISIFSALQSFWMDAKQIMLNLIEKKEERIVFRRIGLMNKKMLFC